MFRKHKGKFAAGSRNRYQSGNVPPVSYTHLTLPTT